MQIPPFKLERYFAKYEFTTRYLMCSSDCESFTVQDLLALEPDAQRKLEQTWLGYTESTGSPALRAEIAGIYATIRPEEVLVHTGAEEAIFLFMHAVLQPGDHIVVHSPCYQSLFEVARSIGCEVSPWMAREQQDWALDLDELTGLLRPATRVIVINTPHNPTGYLMPHADFVELNRIARQNDILLFSDEVYRESEFEPAGLLPSACDINPTAVALGVMSKTYGLAGLRTGWIATHNSDVYARMAGLKDYTTICNSAPGEFLSELALRHRLTLVERNLGIIRSNVALLDDFFARRAGQFAWVRPRAGSIAFPRLLQGGIDEFCASLVTSAGVLLLPGSLFDDHGNHFRVGFGRKNLPDALARLDEYLDGVSP